MIPKINVKFFNEEFFNFSTTSRRINHLDHNFFVHLQNTMGSPFGLPTGYSLK